MTVVAFSCLFIFYSNQDPSGLLLLPPKGAPADFDISPILAVMETLLHVATKEVRSLRGVRTLTFQMNDGFHVFLSPLSVRWWWWMAAVEPAGWCCCPCSGLCRIVCSPGLTCSLKGLPPLPPLWTWPEPFLWNVRSWCLALYHKPTHKIWWIILCNKWVVVALIKRRNCFIQ